MIYGHGEAASPNAIGSVRSILPVDPRQAVSSVATAGGLLLIWVLLDWVSSIHSYKGSLITPWDPGVGLLFAIIVRGGIFHGLTLFGGVVCAEFIVRHAELGVPVTWDQVSAMAGDGVVGRPHIARAMVEAGAIDTPEQAFSPDWIGAGGRAHVTRYALDPVRAIALIRAAGGVTVLAHPRAGTRGWMIPDDVIAALAAAGLHGIEVWHPDQDQSARQQLQDLAATLGLVASGGSDDHGELTGYRIGSDTIAAEAYERLVSQATGSRPVTAP